MNNKSKQVNKVIAFLESKGFSLKPYPRSHKFFLYEKEYTHNGKKITRRYFVGKIMGNVRRGMTLADSISVKLKIDED